MRCLVYQYASDRQHNVQMGITAFLWRQPETESSLARGPGQLFRAYIDRPEGRHRELLRWGFEPGWLPGGHLQQLGMAPWPWVSAEKALASRVFAHPVRYQRCLVPADAVFVGSPNGGWLQPSTGSMFLAGVWDQGTFAVLTAATGGAFARKVGPRMPVGIRAEDHDSWLSREEIRAEEVLAMVHRRREDWVEAAERPVGQEG